ncbi:MULTISPECIES: toxin VasX [Pseudomonas syringae group]|uniref:Putative Membrane protein n=1 Tax=Pseudomonas syringae pv. ribicola TaxID=55398 RepID=A0A3M2W5A9_PSESI|nr:toxin VasX [Pseudomonas syringae group genomosp. 3]RML46595.1 putative Membrane protein [Pseudomonas syringae pv. ribicola]
MTRKTLSPVDKAFWESRARSHVDARNSLSTCPLMGDKVQLLPLRYGRVERLHNLPDTSGYKDLKRPLGLRLVRDGYLYVIDESSGYLHEYRLENGVPTKLLWQDREVAQDVRQTALGEHTLIFPRDSTLHVAYAELQWTAAKCAHVLGSAADRFYFMQTVELAQADCQQGGVHLRVEQQVREQLAELAELPAQQCTTPDMPEGERQDYVWEHQPLFREAHIGELKNALNPFYELNHLYLLLDDSIGLLRDLAQEQDEVVGWLNGWRERNDNEMRYITASYIDTLMSAGDNSARQTNPDSALLKDTTPEQRGRIYDYINARNHWRREHNKGPVPSTTSAGQYSALRGSAYDERPQVRFARLDMDGKYSQMVLALGKPRHEALKDDIDALEENSQGMLNGVGLGSRGIYDLVRHEEMQAYLTQERSHLKRWTQRLDDITHDRVRLFTQGELYRSAWYFDPDHAVQLKSALTMELNCTRDLCRTEESLQKVGDYFHDNPHYILPVFYGRLDMDFLRAKSGSLLKWLDDIHNFSDGLADAQRRIADISHIMGNHWTHSLNLDPAALPLHQAVNASYIPAVALNLERWLIEMQKQLNSPQLRQHLDNFSRASNRAQRLGMLVALQQEAVTLKVADAADVQKFRDNFVRLNQLLSTEDDLIRARSRLTKLINRRTLTADQHQDLLYERQYTNQRLLQTRNTRDALRRDLEKAIVPTGNPANGAIGVRLDVTDPQMRALNDEIEKLRAGAFGGYATQGAAAAALKGSFFPLLAVCLQLGNLGEAWDVWRASSGNRSVKDKFIWVSTLSSVASASISVFQAVYIAMASEAFNTVIANSSETKGILLGVRIGQFGLGLGGVIAPLSLVGAVGTTWNNWEKWTSAMMTGAPGEKSGALMAMGGDIGGTGISAVLTGHAGKELIGFLKDIYPETGDARKKAASIAWATRGSRFLQLSMRLTPWGLIFTALQLGGEALYNYSNLDEEQRWLLHCQWGNDSHGWDWSAHAQKLAETTLLPTVLDQGIGSRQRDGQPVRSLHLILPGLTESSFDDTSLRWFAELIEAPHRQDVSNGLRQGLSVASASPLILALEIPEHWQGHNALLLLRLAVKPALANTYLKADQGYLNYRIPLSMGSLSKPIHASSSFTDEGMTLPVLPIERGNLFEF